MKIKDIRDKSDAELEKTLGELRDELQDLRFKIASRQLKDMASVGKVKKTIARILSVQGARKSEAQASK